MDAKELKKYIYENDLIEKVLTNIGCHSFAHYSKEIRCALPDQTDNSKVSVFINEDLKVRIFTKGETVHGSLYDLISFIEDTTFLESYKKCLSILGLTGTYKKKKTNEDLGLFKKLKKKKELEGLEQVTYDVSILNKYGNDIHIDLIKKDGIIDKKLIDKYSIKFDEVSERIIFPHFKHDEENKIVGIIGRTVNPAYQSLKIPKYFSMEGIKYLKSRNLYGLSHNIDEIIKRGYVIVFESEKSVIKADMFGYPCGVSVGCHDLSEYQKKLLLSLNVEIILAYDKDVELSHIEREVREMSLFRNCSYIYDKWGLIRDKDSPVDRGVKKFNFLFKHRVKV